MNIDLVKNGKIFLSISLFLVIASILAIIFLGLRFGIDFTGGTTVQYKVTAPLNTAKLTSIVHSSVCTSHDCTIQVTQPSSDLYQIQTAPLSTAQLTNMENSISKAFKSQLAEQKPVSVSTIGPSIGTQLRQNAIESILLVVAGIILYIAWAFRTVPKPASSFTFGITAVIAMLHDMIIVIGVFAVLGYFFSAPVDSLFITALLTVMGFSVHDTIVVFDRIRENLRQHKNIGVNFNAIVNSSLMQTLTRSLNTSLTVLLTSLALFLLGGESIRWFVLALLIGITSGTYSSIFVASQALVFWQNIRHPHV